MSRSGLCRSGLPPGRCRRAWPSYRVSPRRPIGKRRVVMRAWRFLSHDKPIALHEVDEPGQVVIRVKASGALPLGYEHPRRQVVLPAPRQAPPSDTRSPRSSRRSAQVPPRSHRASEWSYPHGSTGLAPQARQLGRQGGRPRRLRDPAPRQHRVEQAAAATDAGMTSYHATVTPLMSDSSGSAGSKPRSP